MIKLRNMLIAVIAITALSTSSFAGSIGFGVTGSMAIVEAAGSEQDGTLDTAEVNNKATASNNASMGSIFAEYSFERFNGLTFGVDYLPGSADVNSQNLKRTDQELSETGTSVAVTAAVSRTAQAEIENHLTYYAELPIHGGLYVKAGIASMDVNTTETNKDNSAYGNTSVDGSLFGVGYKNDFGTRGYYKVEGTHTAYDTIKLTQTGASTGSVANTITADLDVTKLTFGVGIRF